MNKLFKMASRITPRVTPKIPFRTYKTLNYGKNIPSEMVYQKSDYPVKNILTNLRNESIVILGYGPQGRSQAHNLMDTGLKVSIGVREGGSSWNEAVKDGFKPGLNLFNIEDGVKNHTLIMNLLSDAAQKETFPLIKPHLLPGKTLYFSHGFSIVFNDQTGVKTDDLKGVDVIMVAPKGSGATVRSKYLEGSGVNASFAVHKDASGVAIDKTLSLGFGIGSPYIYETSFKKEVYSDLTGERGVLMGGIAGLFKAQYNVLRRKGHSPSEAFNETVEEALESLYPLISENGMDYMFANCSTTAQVGALKYYDKFRALNEPLIEEIYESVENGTETALVLERNKNPDYRKNLDKQLEEIKNDEIWGVGKEIRKLRK